MPRSPDIGVGNCNHGSTPTPSVSIGILFSARDTDGKRRRTRFKVRGLWQVLPRVAICDLEALAPHTEIALTGQKENEDKFGQKRVGHGELSWLLDSASVV